MCCWIVLMPGLSRSATAQENYTVRHFDEGNGLSNNFTEAVLQASTGHLVVASKGGIDLFDGRSFIHVEPHNDSIPTGGVTSLFKKADEIWFGTFSGKIGLLKAGQVTIFPAGINGQVNHIHVDEHDGVWAFSRSGNVLWVNGFDTVRFDLAQQDLLINTVDPYKHKEFLIGGNDGVWLIRFEQHGDIETLRQIEGLPETRITALEYDQPNDRLWVGTEDEGLYLVQHPFTTDQGVEEFTIENGAHIQDVKSIFIDESGRLWLGTFGNGLMCIEFPKDSITEFRYQTISTTSNEEYLVRDIYQDEELNIWVATYGGGLIQILESIFNHPFDAHWLKEQSITQLYRDGRSNVWLGTDKGVFRTTEFANNRSYSYYHVGGNRITAIAEDPQHNIWIGTEANGLFRFSAEQNRFVPLYTPEGALSRSINSISVGSDAICVSTKAGLLVYSLNGVFKKHYTTVEGLPHNNINYCFEDSKGRVWVAASGNRVCYLWKNELRFIERNIQQSIVDVNHIIEDKHGRLWFATMGHGVTVLGTDGVMLNLNSSNELGSDYCYQMVLDDDQNVWVSHQRSLTQVSPDLKHVGNVSQDDLGNSENSMITFLFKDTEGVIWISSTHNVVKFNPLIDKRSKSVPQLSLSRILVFDSAMVAVDGLVLPYGKYDISFDLAGISLRDPNAIKYRYRLRGASDAWKLQEGSSSIFFPGLSYGDYELNVLASRNGGPWTPEPFVYRFSIAKPYWMAWWFWVVFVVAIFALFILFVRYRTFRLVKDKEHLESLVSQRTLEIQEQNTEIERSRDEIARYAKDITDSIKYAKRIQQAIFPAWQDVQDILPEAVVFYRPKDLLSGDFYLADRSGSKRIFAAVDCTGHGVPGAFMSIVANNLLQQAIRQAGLSRPASILDHVSKGLTDTLHQTYEESTVKDGMDIAICTWDDETHILEYAGAYNPLFLFRNGELMEIKGNRFPVGAFVDEELHAFTNHEIELMPNDMVYIFTDGFADQFGGPHGKKFMMKRFRELLQGIHQMPVEQQNEVLKRTFEQWKGSFEQVDDICVLGVRFSSNLFK